MPRNTVLLRGNAREEEGIATGSVITPGDLVAPSGTGKGWARQAASGAIAPIAIARELSELEGGDASTNILQNSQFTVIFPELGAKVQLNTAETIARGDEVTYAANGGVAVRASGQPLLGCADGPTVGTKVSVIIGGIVPSESD